MSDIQHSAGKLITCILPIGSASQLLEKLNQEKGIVSGNFNHGRGFGRAGKTRKGIGKFIEKDKLFVAVPDEIADEIFEYIYFETQMDKVQGGLVIMECLGKMTPFSLPEDVEEK